MLPANSVTQQAIITMDWTATILAVAGAKADPAFPLDGMNLLPICTGKKKTVDRTFYWRLFSQQNKKLSGRVQTGKGEFLFNLVDDPGEKNDLIEKFPSLLQQLKKKYVKWEKEVLEPQEL